MIASDAEADAQLETSVITFLRGAGGVESSRNVGRHLASEGLLTELKQRYAGLFHFLQKHEESFQLVMPAEPGVLEYQVHLKPYE